MRNTYLNILITSKFFHIGKICQFSQCLLLVIILILSAFNSAYSQQSNIHISLPPIIDREYEAGHENKEVSASYISMSGEMLDLNGIDVNVIFRKAISNTTASDFTLGLALLYGDMDIDTFERPASVYIAHGSYNREYQVMKRPASSLTLFWGLPLSLGDFVIENGEVVKMRTLVTGIQGGAQLGLKTGGFMSSPFVMVNLLCGIMERYDGGVYYENLDSEGIPSFASITYGLKISYIPYNISLSGIIQKTFESGDNKPINTTIIQLSWSF
jgi:hypothetical protein